MTSQGARQSYVGDCGYRFLIHLNPSSTLPLRLVYRPSKAQAAAFPLPMVLHSNGGTDVTAAAASRAPAASPAAGGRAGSPKPGSATGSRPKLGSAGGVGSKPGSASKAGAAAAAAAVPPAEQLAVPVSALGVLPKLIVSRDAVNFGSCVVRTTSQPGKSPYSSDVYIRNNTEVPLQVSSQASRTLGQIMRVVQLVQT